ncbi:hypothetical protein [Cupriavidus nantongensis]|uniref:Uncharacterized protein n=1 Tax=Cupriavidus nantongensis TaxID=1796606 RepID=A0A142JMF4_9BURK|nr:hypothetical protein [Cupriavidus nantongensis]AMR77689.1 hypothetical protein A2G96_08040 [Cupriavidus nantongensis]AMR79266.1 hypothetical protein A2G96_16830 [Cupriavidus nantongensis]
MHYVKIENGQPAGPIINQHQLRQQLPAGISFPVVIPGELAAEYGFAPAMDMAKPTVGLLESVQDAGFKLVDSTYYQTWSIAMVGSLEAAQAIAIEAIEALAKSKRDAVVSNYSPAEMASWGIKRWEAVTYQDTQDPSRSPNLAMEAQVRDIPLVELVAKVLSKAAALSKLEARIAGTCGRKQDAVRGCTSVAEVKALCDEIEVGWPV